MKNNRMSNNKIALYAVFIALAMVFGYIEMLVPTFFFVPGMKLGLTNIVVLVALYKMGEKEAFVINIVRIILACVLFGNMVSLLYSMAGGILSTVIMIILKRMEINMIIVSIAGAVAHNAGQILVASILLETSGIWWYMLVLWFFGIISGFLIGILGSLIIKRIM